MDFKSNVIHQLMPLKKGHYPKYLLFGTLIGIFSQVTALLNFDSGNFKDTVTLFGKFAYKTGSSQTILIIFTLGCLLFLYSLLSRFWKIPTSIIGCFLILTSLSIHYANQTGFNHALILPSQFLIILCFYNVFYSPNFRSKEFMTYPIWLEVLPACFLGIHYFGSGITKLIESGFSWVDGVSLMTWASLWGDPSSIFTEVITKNYGLSLSAQALILVLELLSFCFLFNLKKMNMFIALGLIGFHVFNEILFHYGFWVNCYFLWFVFIPSRKVVSHHL